MSRITFDNYGTAACREPDLTVVSGRYSTQRRAERLILQDVVRKLALEPDDRLLEIGCGPGNLLTPISFLLAEAVGIDHPDICRRLSARFNDDCIKTIGVNFFDYQPDDGVQFDKILIYNVIHTLANREEALAFLDKAVSLVAPGGRLLLGDIPNADRKRRFFATNSGARFQEQWQRMQAATGGNRTIFDNLPQDARRFQPDDSFVSETIGRYRAKGMEAYTVPQSPDLPFGNTREDLLIIRLPD